MECRATTYVDDWLLIVASQRQCMDMAEQVCDLFRKLQLNINIIPTQKYRIWEGFSTQRATTHWSGFHPKKMRNIRRATSRLLQKAKNGPVPARAIAHVAGRVTAVTRAIAPARLMLRAQGPPCSPHPTAGLRPYTRSPLAPGSNRPRSFPGADSELEWQPLIVSRSRCCRDDRRIGIQSIRLLCGNSSWKYCTRVLPEIMYNVMSIYT